MLTARGESSSMSATSDTDEYSSDIKQHGNTTSVSSASTTSFFKESKLHKVEEMFFTFVLSLQIKGERTKIQDRLLMIFLHGYLMWLGMWIGLQPGYNVATPETYFANIINYPITFGFDNLPYDAAMIITSVIFGVIFIGVVNLIVAYRSLYRMSKHWSKIKLIARIINSVLCVLSMPLIWLVMGFVQCDYDSSVELDPNDVPVQVLHRFPTVACYSSVNILFIVLGIVSAILAMVFACLGVYTLYDPHPKSKTIFTAYSGNIFYLICLSSNLFYCIICLVPYEFPIVGACFYLVSRIALLCLFCYMVPFWKKWENSFYCGWCSACVGVGICGIISIYVNPEDKWDVGTGLLGMFVGTIILFWIIGSVGFHIYLTWALSSVRQIFMEHVEDGLNTIEREALHIINEVEEMRKVRLLGLFMQLSIHGPKKTVHRFSDLEMIKCFIRGIFNQKSYQHVDLLILSGIIAGCFENERIHSPLLLRKASKYETNVLQRFVIAERTKEIEIYGEGSGKVLLEIKHILSKVEKKQTGIYSLHKALWKEYLNDSVSINKIESIIKQIATLTNDCDKSLTNLMTLHGNHKTVLRTYAKFLDEVKFDKDRANEFYEEAAGIEEEESKKMYSMHKKTLKMNKVLPTVEEEIAKIKFIDEDEMNFDGVENQYSTNLKKEHQIRKSLARDQYSPVQFTVFALLSFLSLATLTAALVLSVNFSKQMTSNIILAGEVCLPTAIPRLLLREIRTQQNFINLFPKYSNEIINTNLTAVNSTKDFNQDHKKRMTKYISILEDLRRAGSSGRMQGKFLDDFIDPLYTLYAPVLFYTSNTTAPANYTQSRNATIMEITDSLIKYSNNFLTYELSDYGTSTTNPDFMFYWSNRKEHSNAYDAYCALFLQRNQESTNFYTDSFIYFYVASTGFYVICSVVALVIFSWQLRSFKAAVMLISKEVPKDLVGKIYQTLDKKCEDEAEIREGNILSKTQLSISLTIIGTIIATILCTSMLFVEMKNTADNTSAAIENISEGVNILRTANRIAFRFSEMFTFLKYPSPRTYLNDARLMTKSELDNFHTQNKDQTAIIKLSWGRLYFGRGDTGKSFYGVYTNIDKIINGPTDCSLNGTGISYKCLGMNDLVVELTTAALKYGEDLYYGPYSLIFEFKRLLKHYEMTNYLLDKMVSLFIAYSSKTSVPSFDITIPFALFGYLSLMFLTYITYSLLRQYWNENQQLRLMLNYIPMESLDTFEKLKDYIMFDQLPNLFNSKKMASFNDSGDEKLKSIMYSAVDGAILCNAKGEVELFNPAAQKMFGMTNTDVLGLKLTTLFSSSDAAFKKVEQILVQMTSTVQAFGDTLDIECVRKNQTRFPAKINLMVSFVNHKALVSCFLRDITPEKKQNILLAEEKKKSESLLLNIMPESVATKLMNGETFIAEKFGDVTVFFSDMVGFTKMSSSLNPSELVLMLNTIVNGFDILTDKFNLEKIKTIGDAYFCVGGINSTSQSDHPERILRFAIDTMSVIHDYNISNGTTVNIRVGINTGPVVAGVIGIKKFAYDLWGDTINTASRMESTSLAGRIQISRSTYERVYDLGMDWDERKVDVKGKGLCQTYLLKERHHINPLPSENSNETTEDMEVHRTSGNELVRKGSAALSFLKSKNLQ